MTIASEVSQASEVSESNTRGILFTAPASASLRRRRPRHLLAQWHDCRQTVESLRHADALKRLCLQLCEELHLKVAGNAFFQFEPSGVAGTVLLDDSHIALHTWPEHNMLKADIHLRHNGDESAALALMARLKACFQPAFATLDQCRRPAGIN
jgi:S-adenosylmethionine/arginine decarboxylase-like enzyme